MKKREIVSKILEIALVFVLIGAMLATALPLGALGKNLVSAQEGVSYIIVHALNPEGIEIASIEQVGQNSVGIYDGDTFVGYGAHDAASCNQPITVNAGGHVIKVIFNGITLEQNINLNPNETQTLIFTFKRTSANILSYFDFNESNSITQETHISGSGYWAVGSSSPVYMHNDTHASAWWFPNVILRQEVHATQTITPCSLTVVGSASSSIITEDGELNHLELGAGGTIRKTISIPSQSFNTWWIQNHVTARSDGRASDVWCTLSTGAWWFDLVDWYETGYITKTPSAKWEYTDIGFCPCGMPVREETSGWGKFLTVSGSGTYYIAANELKMSSVPYDLTGTGIKYEENQPPATYTITFDIVPANTGSITFASVSYSDGNTVDKAAATYDIAANPGSGYNFVSWQTTGSLSVASAGSASTTCTVTGAGTLRMVQTEVPPVEYTVTFDTDPASTGSITFDSVSYSDGNTVDKTAATYNIAANPGSGYNFASWATTGGLSVASAGSASTTCTVSGNGTLRMVQTTALPPVASFTYSPENPVVGEEITFDASSSYDLDGTIMKYEWDFDAANGMQVDTEGEVVTYNYSEAGEYTVTLVVMDNDGLTDSSDLTAEVKPVPVIFVHGYYADIIEPGAAMWQGMIAFLEQHGYDDNDLFAIELEPGLLPANGDIKVYARRLSDEIARVKGVTGATKVDLVCHSMGGLVARWYTTHGYHNDVRKLIMIGTPNHGSELLYLRYATWLLPRIYGIAAELGLGTAGEQMTPHSSFLNALNYGAWWRLTGIDLVNTAIHHEVIAGTDDWWFTTWILWGDDDGVVRVERARLDGVKLEPVFSDHSNEYKNSTVFDTMLTILQDAPPLSQQSSTSIQAQQTPVAPQQCPAIMDRIYPGESKSHQIPISATSNATFALAWDGSDLDLTLTSPNGTLIDPSVAEGDPSISYYENGNLTIEGYVLQNPEPGIWHVNIATVDVSEEGEDYAVMTLLETTVTLSLNLSKYQYDPNEPINIATTLTGDGAALMGASVAAEIRKPDESIESITLYDDGLHNDGETDDGIYANSYINTIMRGAYDITVSATGTLDSGQFARETFAAVWVEEYPDLTLASSDICFSNAAPLSGENVTINATIHNIGDADANNASILFYDGEPADGELIGEGTISVSASQTAEASISWNATAGEHELHALISSFSEFLEKDYTNNGASKTIDVTQIGDVNNDDQVNVLDMILIAQHWGQTGSPGWIPEDVMEDGVINVLDMIVVGQHWTG